jgi:hypothetical protein
LNEYRSWSFMDRSFLFGVAVSVLWHLFWFFSVTIVVTPPARRAMVSPRIVSLGPVLDDAMFKTLVESRPEISRAFYRQPADFETATEVPAETIERYSPGDVVSVPFGKRFSTSLKELVSGAKTTPPAPYFELSGPVDMSQVLSGPGLPPEGLPPSGPAEIDFTLDRDGHVADLRFTVSSGNNAADLSWEKHLRQWTFSPEASLNLPPGTFLHVVFHPKNIEDR